MWEAFQADIADRGGHLLLSAKVRGLHHHNGRMTGVEFERGGARTLLPADMVLSTMPLRELIESLSPAAPREVRDAAAALAYRDFLTIALILDTPDAFPDNWIYVRDPR